MVALTKKQLEAFQNGINSLKDLECERDNETVHVQANLILLNTLDDMGLKELSDAYRAVENSLKGGFWYG